VILDRKNSKNKNPRVKIKVMAKVMIIKNLKKKNSK
jgi:hypothetical protein